MQYFVTVSNDDIVRSKLQKGTIYRSSHTIWTGKRNLYEAIRKMERIGTSALCRTAVSANVSLSAWSHQRISQADATERFYLSFAK